MSYILLRCRACGEENEIYCDGDNAMMCPDCRSVDLFEEGSDSDDWNDFDDIEE